MADKTGIEWTDATWNPIVGCSIVSKGCTNCYAMKVAGARTKHTAKYQGLTAGSKAGPVWTGEVRFWEKALLDPLKWKEPRRVFVNSMGDLFHESIPDEWIDRCFAVMALCTQHTFQILTKRPERMLVYLADPYAQSRIARATWEATPVDRTITDVGLTFAPTERPSVYFVDNWPLKNVWLGTSTEDQASADGRIPLLLATPAAKRFISAEPLLGAIDLTSIRFPNANGATEDWDALALHGAAGNTLDWVIVGGESGPKARPMHPDWARSLRDQCQAAGVPFFFKQWGEWIDADAPGVDMLGTVTSPLHPWPDNKHSVRIGKKAAGNSIDGREWSEFPA